MHQINVFRILVKENNTLVWLSEAHPFPRYSECFKKALMFTSFGRNLDTSLMDSLIPVVCFQLLVDFSFPVSVRALRLDERIVFA